MNNQNKLAKVNKTNKKRWHVIRKQESQAAETNQEHKLAISYVKI